MGATELGLSAIVGVLFTLYQYSQGQRRAGERLGSIEARLRQCEARLSQQDQAWTRVESNLNQLITAVARLEERLEVKHRKPTAPPSPHPSASQHP